MLRLSVIIRIRRFLDRYPEKQRQVLKCAKPVIPRANNAIFRETSETGPDVMLDYIDTIPDPNRPPDEHGHMASAEGDSGNPVWREGRNGKAELVGIWHGGLNPGNKPRGWYTNDEEAKSEYKKSYQCKDLVTKITRKMLKWIEEWTRRIKTGEN